MCIINKVLCAWFSFDKTVVFVLCSLILRGLDLHLPRRQVSVATSHALSLVASRLGDPSSGGDVGKCSVDLSSRHQVSSLVRSLLTSKTTVTQLSNSEIDHLTTLLVKVSSPCVCESVFGV